MSCSNNDTFTALLYEYDQLLQIMQPHTYVTAFNHRIFSRKAGPCKVISQQPFLELLASRSGERLKLSRVMQLGKTPLDFSHTHRRMRNVYKSLVGIFLKEVITQEMEALFDSWSQHDLHIMCQGNAQLMWVEKGPVTNFCKMIIKLQLFQNWKILTC